MDLPHLDLPFRFVGGHLATVEQDSVEDIENQVEAVIRCPVGFRDELPEFGSPQPVFETAPVDVVALRAAVDHWVPNAHADAVEFGDIMDDAVRNIRLTIQPETI